MTEETLKPVAWMDDGTTRAGSTATSFRVVTDGTKKGMPSASAVSFHTPLVRLSDAQAALAEKDKRIAELERERDAADHTLVDRYRNPKTGTFSFPGDVAAIVRRLDVEMAEAARLRAILAEARGW